jgi:hypothetical protein
MHGLPAVPGDVGAHTFKDVAVTSQILLGHHFTQLVQERPSTSYAEVSGGPYIVPSQGVHEIHLNSPSSDAPYGDDVGDHLKVSHSPVLSQMDATIASSLSEIEHGGGLGVRETDPSKIRVSRCQDGAWIHVTTAQVDHSLVNSVGSFGGEKLKRDRARESSKAIGHGRAAASRRRTDALDESRKRGIATSNLKRTLGRCHC